MTRNEMYDWIMKNNPKAQIFAVTGEGVTYIGTGGPTGQIAKYFIPYKDLEEKVGYCTVSGNKLIGWLVDPGADTDIKELLKGPFPTNLENI